MASYRGSCKTGKTVRPPADITVVDENDEFIIPAATRPPTDFDEQAKEIFSPPPTAGGAGLEVDFEELARERFQRIVERDARIGELVREVDVVRTQLEKERAEVTRRGDELKKANELIAKLEGADREGERVTLLRQSQEEVTRWQERYHIARRAALKDKRSLEGARRALVALLRWGDPAWIATTMERMGDPLDRESPAEARKGGES